MCGMSGFWVGTAVRIYDLHIFGGGEYLADTGVFALMTRRADLGRQAAREIDVS